MLLLKYGYFYVFTFVLQMWTLCQPVKEASLWTQKKNKEKHRDLHTEEDLISKNIYISIIGANHMIDEQQG